MFILLIDVELVVDVRDLKQLGEGRSTLLRCAAGMLGMVVFLGELQPIRYIYVICLINASYNLNHINSKK